jgi:hypothetical protein
VSDVYAHKRGRNRRRATKHLPTIPWFKPWPHSGPVRQAI